MILSKCKYKSHYNWVSYRLRQTSMVEISRQKETLLSLLCLEPTLLSQSTIKACRVCTAFRYRTLSGNSQYTLRAQIQFASPSEVYQTDVVSQKCFIIVFFFLKGNGIHDPRLFYSPKKSPIAHSTRGLLDNPNLKLRKFISERQDPSLPMGLCRKAEEPFQLETQHFTLRL